MRDDNKQKLVDEFFDANVSYWKEIYEGEDINGIIYQQRQTAALKFIDELAFPRSVHVLEIGCGVGLMSIALAKRGFFVEAIDHAQAMVELADKQISKVGLESRITTCTGDIHDLAYQNRSFDLIVALGVMPWLHDFQRGLAEISRVLTIDGYVVLSMDNVFRATNLLDPLTSPFLSRIRSFVRRKFMIAGLSSKNRLVNAPPYRQHSSKEFSISLRNVGLTVIKYRSVGFGPFTFLGHRLFSDRMAVKIQRRLQEYSDNGYPMLSSAGSQYIVLAKKSS